MIKKIIVTKDKSENVIEKNVIIKTGDLGRIGEKKFRKVEFVYRSTVPVKIDSVVTTLG